MKDLAAWPSAIIAVCARCDQQKHHGGPECASFVPRELCAL